MFSKRNAALKATLKISQLAFQGTKKSRVGFKIPKKTQEQKRAEEEKCRLLASPEPLEHNWLHKITMESEIYDALIKVAKEAIDDMNTCFVVLGHVELISKHNSTTVQQSQKTHEKAMELLHNHVQWGSNSKLLLSQMLGYLLHTTTMDQIVDMFNDMHIYGVINGARISDKNCLLYQKYMC